MFTRAHFFLLLAALAVVSLFLIALGAQPLGATGPICDPSSCYFIQTTTDDFVRGTFYATGLRKADDGEVQLLPIGLTAPWLVTTPLPEKRAELALVSYSNILYAIGGFDGQNYRTEIYSATTSIVGSITAGWDVADNLPVARAGAVAVVARVPDPVLYVIGGGTNAGSTTIYYKKIGAGGSLSAAWKTATLPKALVYSGAFVRGGNLYVFGGTPSGTDSVYRIPIVNGDGDLGSVANDLALPKPLTMLTSVTWEGPANGFAYVLGGLDNAQVSSEDVYSTYFNPDGSLNNSGPESGWNNTSLVDAFNAHGTVQVNGAIYVVGGRQGISSSDAVTKVQTALIDPDGSLHDFGGGVGRWIVTEPIPQPRFFHGTTANDGGEIFMAGGYNNQFLPTKTVYHGSTTGVGTTYAPLGTFTGEPFDAGVNPKLTALHWNAAVPNTLQMGLTLYYRTSNSLGDLSSQPWTLAGPSAQSANGFTNTLTFQSPIENRYLQYKAELSTTLLSNTPLLNAVRVDIFTPPTPTPTATTPSGTTSTPTLSPTPSTGTQTPEPTFTPSVTSTPTRTPTQTLTPVSATPCSGKPGKPTLVSPSNGATLQVRQVPLAWNAVPCATLYKVVVKQGAKNGPKVFKKKVTDPQVTTKALDKDATYYWRVKPINAVGPGKKSEWGNFKVSKNAN